MCDYYKYNPYPYDKCIDNITQEGTGITEILDKKFHKKRLSFHKDNVEKWVEIFRNTTNENLEVVDDFDEDDENEEN